MEWNGIEFADRNIIAGSSCWPLLNCRKNIILALVAVHMMLLNCRNNMALGCHGISWLKSSVLEFIIAFSLIAIPSIATAATHPQDVGALIALRTAWLGNPSSWDISTDPCSGHWLGIWCSNQSRVTKVLLVNQDLAGTLSPAVGNLTYLTELDLSSNEKLGGTLPPEIGNLTNIERFYVQFCNFSGPVPSEIGDMTSLEFLSLARNSFTGPLPATIGLLKQINRLDVSSNHLNGSLPVSSTSGIGSGLDNLTLAQHFRLQNNMFSGSIPSSMFNTEMQLLHLLLSMNEFTESIPPAIENLLHMEILCLDSNFLTGTVPSTINNIANLSTLQLNNNYLTGPLPALSNTKLQMLQLNNNNFTGQIPDLSNNTKLQTLTVGNNPFEASEIPSWITNMTNLRLLSIDSANLIGSIPAEIFNFSPYLSNVTLGSNQLNGTLDLRSANSSSLSLVNLTNNNITNLQKGNYTHELLLDGNPYCYSNPTECQSSTPPTASPSIAIVAGCTNDCPSNYTINPKDSGGCQCTRPVVARFIFYATKMVISQDDISQMEQQCLNELRESNDLKDLTWQDTQAVVAIASSTQVKVSIFPHSGTTEWSSNEADLIAYVLQSQEAKFNWVGCVVSAFMESLYPTVVAVNKLSTGVKIGIGVGVAVLGIAILVLGSYAIKLKRRAVKAEKLNKPFASWIAAGKEKTADIPQLKGARWFSLEEIRKCTNKFSHSNEIGEGGYGKVYKGSLSSGDQVAIKRAGTSSLQGAAEFKNEIELLSRVHHRNLVGLIGFCFEEEEQILVYEYMPNGTLRECLSGRTGLRMVDWKQRIRLALDSARGIAYLHTEANPPIIHSDIKSNNILLDEKLVAKVADFGISKLAPNGDGIAATSTHVRGTMGYLDPDYYMTHLLTDKSDVYSFGVVLLEVVTGRLPIQGGKYIVREVTTALAKGGMDLVMQNLVDPELTDYSLKDVERVVQVALNCVQGEPADRLTMSEVVKELEALVEEGPKEFAMNIDMGEKRSKLYGEAGIPYMLQSYTGTSSFEFSGSFAAISRPILPK